MNHDLNNAARQFVAFVGGEPVAFDSYLHMPHAVSKNLKRQHRLVVRPDYQGVGIGSALSDFVAEKLKGEGFRVRSTTTAPALIFSRKKSPRWRLASKGRIGKQGKTSTRKKLQRTSSGGRITTSWEFV